MGETNIQWCARHRVNLEGECARGATGDERCLDVECARCWVKGYSANLWIGCVPVSEACRHCWAEAVSKRMGLDVWGKSADRKLTGDAVFASVRSWNRKAVKAGQRRGVFWEDMGDIFEDRPELAARRAEAFAVMEAAPGLDHMLLTKRPENALRMVPEHWREKGWPSHVWVGATVEDGQSAFARMPHVLSLAGIGATTFLSVEPLLGNVDARAHAFDVVDLVIVGGESGGGARALDMAAAERLAGDVVDLGTALFWKQMGSRWAQANPGGLRKGASHGQDPYRWPAWARRREMPVAS